jgi:hypothetical protein
MRPAGAMNCAPTTSTRLSGSLTRARPTLKQPMSSINPGPICFTIEVVGNLPSVAREACLIKTHRKPRAARPAWLGDPPIGLA